MIYNTQANNTQIAKQEAANRSVSRKFSRGGGATK